MLRKLTIQNFQIHRKLSIKLRPVTVIVGETGRGKSSIVRALSWALQNDLTGDSFITHGEKNVVVSVDAEGTTITRYRGKKENYYQVDDTQYKAMGREVPEPIAQRVNVSAINFQRQIDSPFWFTLSAGERSKELNNVVDLSWMDNSLGIAASRLRKERTKGEVLAEQVNELESQLSDMKWGNEAESTLDELEVLFYDFNAGMSQYKALANAIENIEKAKRRKKEIDLARSTYSIIADKYGELLFQRRECDRLEKMIDDAKCQKNVPDPGQIRKDVESLADKAAQVGRLSDLVTGLEKISKRCKDAELELMDAEQLLDSNMSEGVCPICRKPLNE